MASDVMHSVRNYWRYTGTAVNFFQTTRRQIPQNGNLHTGLFCFNQLAQFDSYGTSSVLVTSAPSAAVKITG
jgi:hypothetical protein